MSGPDRPDRRSLAALRDHLDRNPADHEARLALGERLIEAGEPDAALRVLTPLEDQPSWARRARGRLATLDEDAGRLAAAEAWAHVQRLRAGRDAAPRAGPLAATPTLDSPGGTSLGRFVIERELGRGATATVYLARDRLLSIELALKVLHPHLATPQRADLRRRFFDEARVAAAMRHPGVVAIHDLDEVTRTLAMEYIPGGALRDRLRARARDPGGGLPASELHALARSLLSALDFIHRHGVVHGDITPRNIQLRRPGEAVLADFGVAHLVTVAAHERERPAGTPIYLAPEQLRGAPASELTDLFSAGAVLWEAIAGHPLRQHADLVLGRHAVRPLPGAADPNQRALFALVTALISTVPGDRPPTAAAAVRALGDP
jgi:serine/threonine-protein kinase